MPDNWMAVGEEITTRLDEIGMQQQELADRSKVSVATIREIQRGKARRRSSRILRDLSAALGWSGNPLEDLLKGRQPDLRSHESEVPGGEPVAFLAKLAFVLEQRVGRVVDVIYDNDSDVDITIEIRHSPRAR